MIQYAQALGILNKIYTHKYDNVFDDDLLTNSLFGPFIPSYYLKRSIIDNTKKIIKYKKFNRGSGFRNDANLPDDWFNKIDMNLFLDIVEKKMKGATGIKYFNRIKYDKSDSVIGKKVFCFKIKKAWFEISIGTWEPYCNYYFNRCDPIGWLEDTSGRINTFMSTVIRRLYRKQENLDLLLPSKMKSMLNRLENFGKIAKEYNNMRWVILVHGEPGTGKTWFFDQLPMFLNKTILVENELLGRKMVDMKRKLNKPPEDSAEESKDLSDGHFKSSSRYSVTRISYDVFDEFDTYVGNYITKTSVETEKSYMVTKFKEFLDDSRGLIVLITNHKDKIDPSVIRDGRVNEVIHFDRNLYNLEEKKNILKYYIKQYKIPGYVIDDDELEDILVASIESKCKMEMFNRGFNSIKGEDDV